MIKTDYSFSLSRLQTRDQRKQRGEGYKRLVFAMASNQLAQRKDVSSNRSDQGGVTFITANIANSSIIINGLFREGEKTVPSSISINGWRYDFSCAQPSEVSKEIQVQPSEVSKVSHVQPSKVIQGQPLELNRVHPSDVSKESKLIQAQPSEVTKIIRGQPSEEISPQELTYKYNDSRHWSIPSHGPARALQVRMLSVSGSKKVEKGKKYKVSFKVLLLKDAFGWDGTPLIVAAKAGRYGRYDYTQVHLNQSQSTSPVTIPDQGDLQIDVLDSHSDPTIHFGLYELSGRKWKGGLEIYSASIEPIN